MTSYLAGFLLSITALPLPILGKSLCCNFGPFFGNFSPCTYIGILVDFFSNLEKLDLGD